MGSRTVVFSLEVGQRWKNNSIHSSNGPVASRTVKYSLVMGL